MILRSLELKGFGKFEEASFEFRRGMNLIAGPNEAGKSTLMEAIPAALFGLREKERFKPWGKHGISQTSLVLNGRDRTLRIERDILSDRVTLTEQDELYQTLYSFEGKAAPLGRSSERAEYIDRLFEHLGFAEEEIFRSSLFFGQGSLAILDRGGLTARIKSLLSGSDEIDYDQVLDSLSRDYFSITRANPWGKDKTKDRELDEIRTRMEALELQWREAGEGLQEIHRIRERMEELKKSIETDQAEFAKGERYLGYIRRRYHSEEKEKLLQKNYGRLARQTEKISELKQRREKIEKELSTTGLPHRIPDDLLHILSEAEKVRLDMVGLQKESAALREQLLQRRPPSWLPFAAVSLILLFACGVLSGFLRENLTVIFSIAGAAALAVWIPFFIRLSREQSEQSRIKGQAQAIEGRREEAQARMATLDDRFEAVGLSPSAVEIVKMQKNLPRHQDLLSELNRIESALHALDEGEIMTREKEEVTRDLAVLDERREKEEPLHTSPALSPEDLPEAQRKLEELGEDIQNREKELLELARREAALAGELGDLRKIEEEGEQLRERENFLVRRKRALAAACELLTETVQEFRRSYLDRFASRIGEYLEITTRGRYGEIRLEEDFSIFLKDRGGTWRPAERYSRGTIDALYFAVRLALTGHLSRGRRLPLLLDDPFVNFDQLRRAEALKILERLSSEHQVILLSHDENLLRTAARDRWHVISLNRPLTKPPREEQRSDDAGQLCFL